MLACAASFDQPTWCSESWIKSPLSLGFDVYQCNDHYETAMPPNTGGPGVFCCDPGNFATDIKLQSCSQCPPGRSQTTFNLESSCSVCDRDTIAPGSGLATCGKFD